MSVGSLMMAQSTVPFVGCASNGQMGPIAAPANRGPVAVPISARDASALAMYEAVEGFRVLAPRGWSCFASYGSGGAYLFVTPTKVHATDALSRRWQEFAGPTVQLRHHFGGTSGRFEVAKIVARVFPAYKPFAVGIMNEVGGEKLVFGPYPSDRLTYKSKRLLEYVTPPQSEGVGTWIGMPKNASSIEGAASVIGEAPDLMIVGVRLPVQARWLAPAIIRLFEQDIARPPVPKPVR